MSGCNSKACSSSEGTSGEAHGWTLKSGKPFLAKDNMGSVLEFIEKFQKPRRLSCSHDFAGVGTVEEAFLRHKLNAKGRDFANSMLENIILEEGFYLFLGDTLETIDGGCKVSGPPCGW